MSKINIYIKIYLILVFFSNQAWALLDENGNGMSDVWERLYDAQNLVAEVDSDLDGQTNVLESVAGTDPNDASSVLVVTQNHKPVSTLYVGWHSKVGVRYQVTSSELLLADDWNPVGDDIIGTGGFMQHAVGLRSERQKFYRIGVVNNNTAMMGQALETLNHDTDGDSMSDLAEIRIGFNPFDSKSKWEAPVLTIGGGMDLTWNSERGKVYQIRSKPNEASTEWSDLGEAYIGNGETITATIKTATGWIYSVHVTDADTDGDGLTDWEEYLTSLNPTLKMTNRIGEGDLLELQSRLSAVNIVTVEANQAVANITQSSDGGVNFVRKGGVDEIVINFAVTGSAIAGQDYVSVGNSVTIPFGVDAVTVLVKPLVGSTIALSEAVIFTLQDADDYDLGNQSAQQINIIREVAINVKDYGAVGDGVSNDTAAVQNAIEALELSSNHNTLFFPAGVYKLDSFTTDSETHSTYYRILRMGVNDLAGKDLIIKGDEGAVLYSTVSPIRAHILEVRGTFRSLRFFNLQFEKDSTVLSEPKNVEPNGADGVSIVNIDTRKVEAVEFLDCKFTNCHGAIGGYGNGYDIRGKLAIFKMKNCAVSNPYGANSIDNSKIWGGGQLVNITPWISKAIYHGNTFDGGSMVLSNPEFNPLGDKKDGSHFGGPLYLEFIDNLVEHMRVESIYQLHDPYMGKTTTGMTIPPADGISTSTFSVSSHTTSYTPGQIIAIRGIIESGKPSRSVSLEVVSYSPIGRRLTVKNTGLNDPDVDGVVWPLNRPIYMQGAEEASKALIMGNVVRAQLQGSQVALAGIVSTANARIANNYIEGYTTGVLIYGNSRTPVSPGGRGTLIENNIILSPDPTLNPNSTTYGVQSWGPDELIRRNTIITPISTHFMGIGLRGENSEVKNNTVISLQVMRNGYGAAYRSVGVGVGNTSLNARISYNNTYGFDVGVGPIGAYQSIPHFVNDNVSVNDALAVDPRGVIPE